jgi:hypothetical protein
MLEGTIFVSLIDCSRYSKGMIMKKNKFFQIVVLAAITISSFILFNSCDTTETQDATISVSLSSETALPKITDDPIQLDEVKILFKDIKIKNQSNNQHPHIKVGTFMVSLNLNGMTTDFAVANVSQGIYDRVKFEVHRLEDSEDPPDPEFRDGALNYSVIVKGTYNSLQFRYRSRKSAHQDLKLETPVEVGDNETANLTITVDPYSWFFDGDVPMNPSDPSNENLIDNNIERSFKKCYRDDDHNGMGD